MKKKWFHGSMTRSFHSFSPSLLPPWVSQTFFAASTACRAAWLGRFHPMNRPTNAAISNKNDGRRLRGRPQSFLKLPQVGRVNNNPSTGETPGAADPGGRGCCCSGGLNNKRRGKGKGKLFGGVEQQQTWVGGCCWGVNNNNPGGVGLYLWPAASLYISF